MSKHHLKDDLGNSQQQYLHDLQYHSFYLAECSRVLRKLLPLSDDFFLQKKSVLFYLLMFPDQQEKLFRLLLYQHYLNLYEPTLTLRDIIGAISRAKDELVDASQCSLFVQKMRDSAVWSEEIIAGDMDVEVAYEYDFY